VEAGKLDIGLGIFKRVPGVRRTPFFRFSLILIRAEQEGCPGRATMTWQLIDQQLVSAGVVCPRDTVVNLLDTQIALVEANEGVAIIPSFGLPVARNRKVTMIASGRRRVHGLSQDLHLTMDRPVGRNGAWCRRSPDWAGSSIGEDSAYAASSQSIGSAQRRIARAEGMIASPSGSTACPCDWTARTKGRFAGALGPNGPASTWIACASDRIAATCNRIASTSRVIAPA
jgi:hypothetical protein